MAKTARRKATVQATARKGRKPPPPNETRGERFCRIGERRMNDVLTKVALIGNLSGGNYDCTSEQLKAMRQTIDDALELAFARFVPRKGTDRNRFSFQRLNAETQH